MSDTVIRVEHLGKKYVLSRQQPRLYPTVQEQLSDAVKLLRVAEIADYKPSSTIGILGIAQSLC